MVFLHGSVETVPAFGVCSKELPPWRDNEDPPLVDEGLSEGLLYGRAACVRQGNGGVNQATVEEHDIINRLRSLQVGQGDLDGPPCEGFHIDPWQRIARSRQLFCHDAPARLLDRGKAALAQGLQQS